ncbi:mannose-6-phosphate isomerase, class I [Gulosibacter faecalis]|uniref:mannose-6-phosphate isomerase n=1 Tax=Gulosibacter faecalis TaxID=272240 RepID=A0ABW5UT30_9MICO|nr:mannose-6-phosphate isomerase, class I [Gulosibacter faecalis]
MFVPLENTPMRYAWGAEGAISDLLGTGGALTEPERGAPRQAELWFGTHDGSPTRVASPELTGGVATLRDWVAAEPDLALGERALGVHAGPPRLPYLLKVLAAAKPLSLQVHPNLAEARAGFAAENAAGVPIDAPHRNYRDALHKPELLVALSETMSALAGFREPTEVRDLVDSIVEAADARGRAALEPFVTRVAAADSEAGMRDLLEWILTSGEPAARAADALDAWSAQETEEYAREQRNLARIRAEFPGDASALTALLMNHVVLHRGEALYVRAGVLHAYLEGLGIEVMAASDNVLRGGLTVKHVDVPELLRILDVAPTPPPVLAPGVRGNIAAFVPSEPDFMLQRAHAEGLDDELVCAGPGIALCVAGSVRLEGAGSGESKLLGRGDAVYVTPDEGSVRLRGRGDVLLATINPYAVAAEPAAPAESAEPAASAAPREHAGAGRAEDSQA